MQVSCKISYSVLVYIERQGVQLDSFFESFETPVELLKDPSCWLEIDKMEQFLKQLTLFMSLQSGENLFREIGQHNFELRAWGVLDSVLKMVESPKDIFSQPDRFLSYFLTPHPELEVKSHEDNKIIFSLQSKPSARNVLSYLMGAVEGLPNYMGMPQALIESLGEASYSITWFDDQESLFDEKEKKHRQFHPEIVHSVIKSFHEQNINLEDGTEPIEGPQYIANEAFEKMVALEVEKRMAIWVNKQNEFDEAFFKIKNDFYKMYDYFTRAQQIITLISPTARQASVREAMRRVDWEYVQKEFPKMVEGACDTILSLKDTYHSSLAGEVKEERETVDLNGLIDCVVERLSLGEKTLKIDKQLLLDRNIQVEPKNFAEAIEDILNNSVQHSSKETRMKIVTRPVGSKVQIEITDSSSGISSEELENIFDQAEENNLKKSQEVIERHHGNISISSRVGEGSTYLIELPV